MSNAETYAQSVKDMLWSKLRVHEETIELTEDVLRSLLAVAYLAGSAAAYESASAMMERTLGPVLVTKAKETVM
jgi:hypothetical protein